MAVFQTIGADLLTLAGFDGCSEVVLDCVFCACSACFLARVCKSWALVASELKVADCIQG